MFFSLKEKNQKKRTFFKRKYQRITLNKIIKGTDVLSKFGLNGRPNLWFWGKVMLGEEDCRANPALLFLLLGCIFVGLTRFFDWLFLVFLLALLNSQSSA